MKVIAHPHCHLSQDIPEVVSSGVPVPDSAASHWKKNKDMILSFSTDRPWNAYKATWHNDIPEQVVVVMAIGNCVLATVILARRVHHVVVVVAHIYVSCRCIQSARPCFASCAVAREC